MDPICGRGKKSQVSLPEEITREEILIRLPVKSLVRSQAVCKSWESVLHDPDFMQAHIARNMKQNPNDHANHLVALYSSTLRILSSSDQTFKQTGTRVFPLFVNYLLGSVNGLVCVSKFDRFFICNPAIGKIKDTYLAPYFNDIPRRDDFCTRILGFGWDHVRDEYKIVACYLSYSTMKGAVYSSSSNSWTELVLPDSVFPRNNFLRNNMFEAGITVLTPTNIIRNCPYWRYASNTAERDNGNATLVKFEVETNEFRLLPEFDHDTVRGKKIDLVNLKDCPAVLVYNEKQSVVGSVDLHYLDEVSGIWIKMYTMEPINSDFPSVRGFKGYLYGGEIMFDDQGKLFCYDPEAKVITSFLGCHGFPSADCFSYTPTLVFLPEMKKKVLFVGPMVPL